MRSSSIRGHKIKIPKARDNVMIVHFIFVKAGYNTIRYMVFQNALELVLIQQISIGFES